MKEYKVGDVVKIRTDLTTDTEYGSNNCVEAMIKHCGEETTIARVIDYTRNGIGYEYCVEADGCAWQWTPEMFE